ncbi:MAG: lipase family protein [Methylomonas sp.]|nr:lipase family protein [Methylomonas sp.]
MSGTRFQHVIYSKSGRSSKSLHIYLDGDGIPWIAGRPADDPTPRNTLMLRLMNLDRAPAAYVGRPCYHGMRTNHACSSRFWLSHRYGQQVVASLLEVIKQLLRQGNYRNVVLFGHSGGGALAVLLASRLAETVAVVTVAANLDMEVWAAYTENDDLKGSLNPAAVAPLDPAIKQYHYAGAEDDIVPASLMAAAAKHLGSRLIVIDEYDHLCCWERLWTSILDDASE